MELRRDGHGSDTQELQLVKRDALLAKVTIDNVHCDKERFRQKTEFDLDDYQPVDKNFSLVFVELGLAT